jgi:serine protease Do
VGDVVFAIGEPFGLTSTATMGIVSATGRGDLGIENYEDFIQTDAAINPGNSGGAMIDLRGNLIGINTAILAENGGGNQGIGFAIPINMARAVMDQIVSHGKVVRGYLGLYPQDVTPALAKQFGLSQPSGALVGEVEPDTPAARAGLKRGDVIVAMNGQAITSANDLRLRVSEMAPGTTVKLQISREGKTQDVNVALAELPEKAEKAGSQENGGSGLEGVEVQPLTPDIAEQLQLSPGTRGVVVWSVDPASPAASSLQKGDVIQEVNHKAVSSIEQFRQAVSAAGKGSVLLLVNRQGVTTYVVLESQ